MTPKQKSMKARLAIYKGAKLDLSFPLAETASTIGRDAGNAVQLSDPEVSKHHAIVRAQGDAWTIEDLDSTNGVIVNKAKVKHARLKEGDKVRIGPFELVFECSATGEWTSSLVIDLSTQVAQQTIPHDPGSPLVKPGGGQHG
jgi:pSer/pThr/pTyr-binding forkhead associated (FHA) protein